MAGMEVATGELFDKSLPYKRVRFLTDLRSVLLTKLMLRMDRECRYRWCGSGACACMGAANCSGKLSENGFTKEEWEMWITANPESRKNKEMIA